MASLREARVRHAKYYLAMLGTDNELYFKGAENALVAINHFDMNWEQTKAAQLWAAMSVEIDSEAAELCSGFACNAPDLLKRRRHSREMLKWCDEGLKAAQKSNQSEFRIAMHLQHLGAALHSLGRLTEAVNCLRQSVEKFQKINSLLGEGDTLTQLAGVYATLGDNNEAIKYYDKALIVYRQLGDSKDREARTLNSLGKVYQDKLRFKRALKCHEEALTIYHQIGYRFGEGDVLLQQGRIHSARRQSSKAIVCYLTALDISRELNESHMETGILFDLGILLARCGMYAKAIGLYSVTLKYNRESGDRVGEAHTLHALGEAFEGLLRYPTATQYYRLSRAIFSSMNAKTLVKRVDTSIIVLSSPLLRRLSRLVDLVLVGIARRRLDPNFDIINLKIT